MENTTLLQVRDRDQYNVIYLTSSPGLDCLLPLAHNQPVELVAELGLLWKACSLLIQA